MLERLGEIPWDELSHAYGKATDVPGLLRDLASSEKAVWDRAIGEFYGNIWHQGTVYSATAHAVPFLIELLRKHGVVCKPAILCLLRHLGTGRSYLAVHQGGDWYRSKRHTDEFRAQLGRELGYVKAAAAAVAEGTPDYLELLSDADAEKRAFAAYTLTVIRGRDEAIEPELLRRLASEPDPEVRAAVVTALAKRRRSSTVRAALSACEERFIATLRKPDEAPLVRCVAALAVIELLGPETLEEALAVVRETMTAAGEGLARMAEFEGASIVDLVGDALSRHPAHQLQWYMETSQRPEPGFRKDAVWSMRALCRRVRSAPQTVVPRLAEMVADSDREVRATAARELPQLGKARFLAEPILERLSDHPDSEVRSAAAETLRAVKSRPPVRTAGEWLGKPRTGADPAGLISALGAEGADHQLIEVVAALELLGPAASEAAPALRRLLTRDSHWLRVRAARALWKITGEAEAVLPVLLDEIRARPAGLVVAEVLAEMGPAAAAAVPVLRRIISSETSLVEVGLDHELVDLDEAFHDAAERALSRIESGGRPVEAE